MILPHPWCFTRRSPSISVLFVPLLSGKLNMDVSVSITIGGAYVANCFATVNGTGEVYFESVSMFTFFLLLGATSEQKARIKGLGQLE